MGNFVQRTVVRHSAIGLTSRKHAELQELARRFVRARRAYVDRYWHPQHLSGVLRSSHKLVERQRRSGWGETGLGPHHSKVALESALGLIRSNWMTTVAAARDAVMRDAHVSGSQRRWMFYVMRWPELLEACVLASAVRVPEEWTSGLDERWLAQRLRRVVLRRRPRKPRSSRRLWFEVDTNLYRAFHRPEDRHFRGAWVAIAGLRPRHRICVPLAGATLDYLEPRAGVRARPSLRLEVGERLAIHTVQDFQPRQPIASTDAGLDLGYRVLLTLSTGDPDVVQEFGVDAHQEIARTADTSSERLKNRRRLVAYERSIRNTCPAKARRIRQRSLGEGKLHRRSHVESGRLREIIDRSLNELFRGRPDVSRLCVEDLRFRSGRLSREMNRRLGRWLKGVLRRRLTEKAQLNGVELKVVNAAYTSQACPRCAFVSKANRSGTQFECRSCGYFGRADAVAATNVLMRGSDRAITRFTPRAEVRQILEARWRSARIGRAWGSNDVSAVPVGMALAGQSREQPRAVARGSKGDVKWANRAYASPASSSATAKPGQPLGPPRPSA